jgi:two-component system, OmpR family, response regulator MprA
MAAILIIDDEPEVCRALTGVLTRAGFGVTAVSAAEGIAAFERERPDIVITDIIMPKIHGIDIIKSIRTKSTTVRIIAISGGGNFGPLGYKPGAITTQAYLAAAVEAGADEVLSKPFEKGDLLATVRRVLDH